MKKWYNIYLQTHFRGILAGVLIGIGVIINVQTSPPILGAFLFSFGLLTIIRLQLPLYTGKVGFIINNYKQLPWILCNNIIGIIITVCGYVLANPSFELLLKTAAENKFQKSYIAFLMCAVFCGILIHFAIKCNNYIITIMAVIIFILIGAEHCIADMPYLVSFPSWKNLFKIIITIFGNSLGAVFVELWNQMPISNESSEIPCELQD